MENLIEKLEQAEVGSRELDVALGQSLGLIDAEEIYTAANGTRHKSGNCDPWPAWTTSLDAALALAERLGLQAGDILHEAWRAMAKKHALHMRFYTGKNYASEAALCACAALLRAQSEAR